MGGFFLRQLSTAIPTLMGVSLLAFALVRLVPGDPVLLMLGERGGSEEQYAQMEKKLGLHLPLYRQYLGFIGNAATGDLGKSTLTQRPVTEEFFSRFPATLELGLCAILFAVFIGIPAGVVAAMKHHSAFDYTIMGLSLVGHSMPIFWWALILIIAFSVNLGLTPVSGRIHILYDIPSVSGLFLVDTLLQGNIEAFFSALRHLLLPTVVIGTIPLAVVARMTRSSMLEVLHKDYVRTARAKGLEERNVLIFHALRNALIPLITVIGLQFGSIITGAILTETIFSWPGIGKWMVHSVEQRDYPVIQGGVLIIASMVIFINMAVDAIYALVNPQMKRSR
ncbi:MAG: ABC transporter permease subunit [Bacteriovoracales bacterium]|nr:ABC transporter permease subunit [Bacteriovoracales bacterium]